MMIKILNGTYYLFLVLISLVIIAMMITPLFCRENIYGVRYDYLLHHETGMIMGIALQEWTHNTFYTFGVPAILAGAKEYYDYRTYGRYDIKDFGYSILGAMSGYFLTYTF